MRECVVISFGIFAFCNVVLVNSFNVDLTNYSVYRKNTSSMFGFTVALHKDGRNTSWVLVGAPEAQSKFHNPEEIRKGGAVYKCRPDDTNSCEEIPFNKEGNKRISSKKVDDRSYQWLGATLSSSGRTDGPVVACAPRYVWHTLRHFRRDPVGTCFVSNSNFDSFEEYSPCRTMLWGYHRLGSCQGGFSAAINKVGNRLYIGAPGSYYWQGQVYSIDTNTTFNYTSPDFQESASKGSSNHDNSKATPPVFSTRQGISVDDDSYMGYSTVVGNFKENEEYEGIAVGMPRGNNLRGKVLLFTWNLTNYKNLTVTKQIGSYFGYSITAADVNGDGKSDIIVGAPMHTEPNNEMNYDVGRVYVFYQDEDEEDSFNAYDFIDGFHSMSRFGHAVSTLADLNSDGYEDFAVGAPYDGPEGRGAVYIYSGSRKGILKKYSQVIYAEDVHSRIPVNTFGFSLAGGVDLDGNDYPDMAVGAYLSDAAFLFRAQPVIHVRASVQFQAPERQIDLSQSNCILPNNQNSTCTSIIFCVKYTGKGTPPCIYLSTEYVLDSKQPSTPRLGFVNQFSNIFNITILLQKDAEQCTTKKIYVKSDLKDKLTPFEVEVKYSLRDDQLVSSGEKRSSLHPILNPPQPIKDIITIKMNCGLDEVCIPDLQLEVMQKFEKYLLGSGTNLEFEVVVLNVGEDSYGTLFTMKYPDDILYVKTEIKTTAPVLCRVENNILICDIGNPLSQGNIVKFKVIFRHELQRKIVPSLEFEASVSSSNSEMEYTMADNHKHVSIRLWVPASIVVTGASSPPTIYYNESLYNSEEIESEQNIGPQVTHTYFITNTGPVTIEEAEIFIWWPIITDQTLLHLLGNPVTGGDVKCEIISLEHSNATNSKGEHQISSYRFIQETHWQESREEVYHHNASGQDVVSHVDPSLHQTHKKRAVVENSQADIQNSWNCSSGQCELVRCVVENLRRNEEAEMSLRFRLNVRALRNTTSADPATKPEVLTEIVAQVRKLPYIGKPTEDIARHYKISTAIHTTEQ